MVATAAVILLAVARRTRRDIEEIEHLDRRIQGAG